MNRLIIVGSPRVDGRSAHLANLLFESCIEECPDDELALAPVSTLDIAGCQGCDACKRRTECAQEGDADDAGEAALPCAIDDDMQELYELIDAADELVVVSPVYFSGPPSQLKALLDRFQPYFWTDARRRVKRPCTLHVVGEGGDPHGYDALVGCVRSAAAVAGFKLETVFDWVGKIDDTGEIVADATEISLDDAGALSAAPAGEEGAAAGAALAASATAGADGAPEPGASKPREAQPGASWGERGSARKRLSLDDARASSSKGASRASGNGGKNGGSGAKQKAHRNANGPKKSPGKPSGSRSGGKGSKGGKRRG